MCTSCLGAKGQPESSPVLGSGRLPRKLRLQVDSTASQEFPSSKEGLAVPGRENSRCPGAKAWPHLGSQVILWAAGGVQGQDVEGGEADSEAGAWSSRSSHSIQWQVRGAPQGA